MAGLTGARGAGLLARRVEDAADLGNAMREVLAHDGQALIDVVCARQELAMPPRIEAEQVKGFSLWAIKAVIDGRGAQIIDLALTNLFR